MIARTQTALIFDHLVRKGSITPYEARDLYRVNSFHRRMADLRDQGIRLAKTRKIDNTGRAYVEYRLAGGVKA
jgi:hypothetical protein